MLVLSILFYASWYPVYVVLPFLLCAGVYFCGRRMTGAEQGRRRMWRGIWFTLAILAFFKYRIFLVENLNALLRPLGMPAIPAGLWIALPLGISFYSFEAVSYLIDKRQGRIKQESFLDLALFVHLLAAHDRRPHRTVSRTGAAVPQHQAMGMDLAGARPGPAGFGAWCRRT